MEETNGLDCAGLFGRGCVEVVVECRGTAMDVRQLFMLKTIRGNDYQMCYP
jgi:hypothetical protein